MISYVTAQSLEEVKYFIEQYDDSFWGSNATPVKMQLSRLYFKRTVCASDS